MWVVHIQLNGSEKIRNPIGLNIGSVYHVFVFATNDNLSGYHNFIVLIITQRALFFVSVVKCDRYRGFGNSSLTIFVHKFLEICSSHLKTIKKDENSTHRGATANLNQARPNILPRPFYHNFFDRLFPIRAY